MYIGRENIYGLFEKQILNIQVGVNEYTLLWKVGSSSSILVVSNKEILEPMVDYSVVLDGRRLVFTVVPNPLETTYVIYLGRELSVARTVGIEPKLDQFIGDGINTTFNLSVGPVVSDAVIVFLNGVQQKLNDDFTVIGTIVEFSDPPPDTSNVSVYIHGVERFDSSILEDGSVLEQHIATGAVTSTKIGDQSITYEKMNLDWVDFIPSFETFGGMIIAPASLNVNVAKYKRTTANTIKVKLDFQCIFDDVEHNIIRYSAPLPISVTDEICPANVTLSSDSILENGMQTWGTNQHFDIHRNNNINYTLGEVWRFKIRAEYDIIT